eukprot:gene5703-17599_t
MVHTDTHVLLYYVIFTSGIDLYHQHRSFASPLCARSSRSRSPKQASKRAAIDSRTPMSSYKEKPVAEWTAFDVSTYLNEIGLGSLEKVATENALSGNDLVELTQEELQHDLGITRLQARKMKKEAGLPYTSGAPEMSLAPPSGEFVKPAEETPQPPPAGPPPVAAAPPPAPNPVMVVDANTARQWGAKMEIITRLEQAQRSAKLEIVTRLEQAQLAFGQAGDNDQAAAGTRGFQRLSFWLEKAARRWLEKTESSLEKVAVRLSAAPHLTLTSIPPCLPPLAPQVAVAVALRLPAGPHPQNPPSSPT